MSADSALITCREAPNLSVSIRHGRTVTSSSARKAVPGSIFVDGAADAAPFLDNERHVYNLDHHADCVRSFTLATCEQAYILIRKGFNLREREWTIHANDPDLDTVLAIWLLLNHTRINDSDGQIREKILPLVRLEGVIDVHGLEMQELACLPPTQFGEAQAWITELMREERALKQKGAWEKADFTAYTLERLREIDQIIYAPWQFEGFQVIDEIARVDITGDQVAVFCRSDAGIYEVEKQLLSIHGKRLGIIILQKTSQAYVLRQVSLFLHANLNRLYAQLNLIDPAVKRGNRWGGSDTIGGSPRRDGTRLDPEEIALAVRRAYAGPAKSQVVSRLILAVVTAASASAAGWSLSWLWAGAAEAFPVGFLLVSLLLLLIFAKRYPRLYGLQGPEGRDWALLFPLALAGAAVGGVWIPASVFATGTNLGAMKAVALALGLPLAAELLFRGVAHGLLAEELKAERSGGRWFLSWPVVGSATLYALSSVAFFVPRATVFAPDLAEFVAFTGFAGAGFKFLSALVFGLACGIARERSASLLPAILFHWLGVGILLLSLAAFV